MQVKKERRNRLRLLKLRGACNANTAGILSFLLSDNNCNSTKMYFIEKKNKETIG